MGRIKKQRGTNEDPPLELIEKAFDLLKDTPLTTLACYLIGTLPFGLGFIYFWMDMTRSPFATNHQVLAAAGLAFLFFWMKCWQGLFVKKLSLQVQMNEEPKMTLKQHGLFILRHGVIQGAGLFILPLSIALLLPVCWAYAFFQNALYYGADPGARSSAIFKKSLKMCALWPRQNHIIIWLINPLILFLLSVIILVYLPNLQNADGTFFIIVYTIMMIILVGVLSPLTVIIALNLLAVIMMVPMLLRMLMGIETAASENIASMFNSSTLALLCCLVYLLLDPLVKATYVLRCFYGDAILSGQDIRAGVMRIKAKKAATTATLIIIGLLSFIAPENIQAAEDSLPTPLAEAPIGDPEGMRQSIETELEKPIYSWRLPRERKETDDDGIANTLDEKLEKALERFFGWMEGGLEKLADWLDGRITPQANRPTTASNVSWGALLETMAWLALAILVASLIVLVIKHFRPPEIERVEDNKPVYAAPNLEDENLSADELPEDEWVTLAMEMMRKGDYRLAVRALFLSGLAFLGDQRLLQIRRFKSNREYLRELRRRSHVHANLSSSFEWSVTEFEGIWYGAHEANQALFDSFSENLSTIKQDAAS